MNDSKSQGISVLSLLPNSPADKAGVKVGDVIISVNDIPVSNWAGYIAAKDATVDGIQMMDIIRGNQFMSVRLDVSGADKNPNQEETIAKFRAIGGLPGTESKSEKITS